MTDFPEPAHPASGGAIAAGRLAHTMLRVRDLERSLAFYVDQLGMTLCRREDYPDGRFTLAFVGYGSEHTAHTLELTHNWETDGYEHGTAYGHVALLVPDVREAVAFLQARGVTVQRAPGPMAHRSPQRSAPEVIAFIADPDGYRIELIESHG
jgi:lactoylglutathione lyase